MIQPEKIPQFTGNLEQLETDYADLKKDAGHVRDAGGDIHSRFQGLSAFYQAPEAEKLFATTKPVKEKADAFADDLEKVSGALSSYATEIRPLVAKLKQLKADAAAFVSSVKDDDEWEYDEDKVDEHNKLRDDITATVAAFWAAERTCHNKITALWGGTQMVAGDGSDKKNQYGFNAEDMKNAKLPWGDPVEEKHKWYEVGHWVKSFVWDGLIVDGIWGTIKGLGTLVGFGGWEAMGQAWKGLAQLATGLVITAIPGAQAWFWTASDKDMPSWLRDSRTAMKETGKALVAWDQWGKNPARAAGAVTFNVLTTVFTGGAGAAASGAGKAGAVAKALSVAGKAGRVIDPMTYIAKGAGAGLSKIGDITKGLKGVGNIDIPALPENAVTLPEGTAILPDGTVRLPDGASVPEGATKLPDGNVRLPDDVPVLPEGTTKLPTEDGAPARYYDPDGNILDEHGNVLQKSADGPGDVVDQPHMPDTPTTGADTPRANSPAQQPALVTAGAHTAEGAGQHIRLGNSLDEGLGDVGRVGDDGVTPVVHAGGNLPGSALGDHLAGSTADHLPGSASGANTPVNAFDAHTPTGTTTNTVPGTETGGHGRTGHPNDTSRPHSDGHELPRGDSRLPGPLHESPVGGGALDDAGGLGSDELNHMDGTGDPATTPEQQPHDGTGHGSHNGQRELSVEERKRIQDQHVWKANNDPDWFAEHYDEIGRRKSAERIVDGVELPILTKDANNNWIAKYNLPHGPSETKFAHTPLGPDSVPPTHRPPLDEAARNRRLSVDLTNAERAYEEKPSLTHERNLKEAQSAYAEHLEGIPNNSKISEHLGEQAAKLHVIPKEFPHAEWVELPKTANGANMFDQLYKLGDGEYLIVEAKAPSGELGWRNGMGSAQGMRVKQGTREYVETIIAEMQSRAPHSPRDGRLALDLLKALKAEKLQYVMVKASDNPGSAYAGATLDHFKIY
ncbi:hypothetical protein ABZ313_43190 [Streptomyces sp. NPDC006251]|uniref:hypothetical protein n=1 Tax=Streptomyces sp. NPDC006251 TaxID=3155718 RepID=UPI0033AC9018